MSDQPNKLVQRWVNGLLPAAVAVSTKACTAVTSVAECRSFVNVYIVLMVTTVMNRTKQITGHQQNAYTNVRCIFAHLVQYEMDKDKWISPVEAWVVGWRVEQSWQRGACEETSSASQSACSSGSGASEEQLFLQQLRFDRSDQTEVAQRHENNDENTHPGRSGEERSVGVT